MQNRDHIAAVRVAIESYPQLWRRLQDWNERMELMEEWALDSVQEGDATQNETEYENALFYNDEAGKFFLRRVAIQQELMIPDPV